MENVGGHRASQLFGRLVNFLRKCLFKVISAGPIPDHIAFIMDGNRRYAKKLNSAVGAGHRAGYSSLMSLLVYCYELGVKYVTVYAFSIDNFKRPPGEVQFLMDLMLEKIEDLLAQQSLIDQYGIRLHFIGNLKLLSEPVRVAAEKAMRATAGNNKAVLLVCVAYTSCDEIVHAINKSCKDKRNEVQALLESNVCNGVGDGHGEDKNIGFTKKGLAIHDVQESCENKFCVSEAVEDNDRVCNAEVGHAVEGSHKDELDDGGITTRTCNGLIEEDKQRKLPTIKLVDVEKHMYMAIAPDPDIVIRSSGEMRLSNFLVWQTDNCQLYSPCALWPELGLRHLVWAVLNFQRSYWYLEKKRKKL